MLCWRASPRSCCTAVWRESERRHTAPSCPVCRWRLPRPRSSARARPARAAPPQTSRAPQARARRAARRWPPDAGARVRATPRLRPRAAAHLAPASGKGASAPGAAAYGASCPCSKRAGGRHCHKAAPDDRGGAGHVRGAKGYAAPTASTQQRLLVAKRKRRLAQGGIPAEQQREVGEETLSVRRAPKALFSSCVSGPSTRFWRSREGRVDVLSWADSGVGQELINGRCSRKWTEACSYVSPRVQLTSGHY
jgi:hypothetical protein